jgi:hypothetical protein
VGVVDPIRTTFHRIPHTVCPHERSLIWSPRDCAAAGALAVVTAEAIERIALEGIRRPPEFTSALSGGSYVRYSGGKTVKNNRQILERPESRGLVAFWQVSCFCFGPLTAPSRPARLRFRTQFVWHLHPSDLACGGVTSFPNRDLSSRGIRVPRSKRVAGIVPSA